MQPATSETRWWKKMMLFALGLLTLGLPALSLTAKSKKKKPWPVQFSQQIKKNCYTAHYTYNRNRSKLSKTKQLGYMLRLARCFRDKYSYPHYYARNYYNKVKRVKGVAFKIQMEAEIFMLRYQVRYVYYYSSRYYQARRKRFEKAMAKVESKLTKRGLSTTSRWFGELQLLRVRYYKRVRRYDEAWQLSQTLVDKAYPAIVRDKTMLFVAMQLIYNYRPSGYPFNQRERKIKYFRTSLKRMTYRKYRAQMLYFLAHELKYTGDKGFEEALKVYKKAASLKKSPWSEYATRDLENLTTPKVRPAFPMQIAPDKSRKITVNLSRTRKATFVVYRANLQKVFEKYNSIFALQELKLKNKILSLDLKLKKDIKPNFLYGHNKAVTVELNGLAAGNYVVEMVATNRYNRVTRVRMPLLVSHAQLILKQARKELLVSMVDGRTNKPIPGAKVIYTIGRRSYNYYRYHWRYRRYRRYPTLNRKKKWPKLKVHRAVADSMGLFRRDFKKVKYNRQVNLMACVNGVCAMGQSGQYRSYGPYRYYYYSYYYYRRLQHKVFWTTDRGAYRPGQTVFFKGIYHRQRYLKWENTKGLRVRVWVRDSKGKKLYKKLFTLGELGTFEGSFKVKKGAPLGVYNVTLQMLYRNPKYNYAKRTVYKKFRVEEYRRPKFVVSAVLKPGIFTAGDKLKWKIKARYTFGGPVKNAKVRWTLRREYATVKFSFPRPFAWYFQPQRNYGYRRYWRYRRYRYRRYGRYGTDKYYFNYYKRLMQQYRRYMRMYSNNKYYRRWYKKYRRLMLKYATKMKPLAQGTGTLNSKGELSISTPSKSDNGYFRYVLTAEVTDVSRRTIKGSGSTVLGKQGAMAYIRTTKQVVLPGEKVKVLLRTLRPGREGVSVKGKLYLVRSSKKQGELKDISSQSISVKTNAEGKAVVRFFADYLGHFRLVFVGKLPNGQKLKTETTIWLGSDKLKDTDYKYKRLEIVSDRDLYKIGQTASILINTPNVPDSFLVTVEGEGLHWASIIKAKGRSTLAQLPVLAKFTPNAWVTVTYLFKGQLFKAQQRIVVPPTHKFLNVSVTPFKKSYRPGEKVKWKVKITDKKGRPVKSNLLLFAYDKSLDLIGKVAWPDIRKNFYDRQQSQGVATVASVQSMRNYANKLRTQEFARKQVAAVGGAGKSGGALFGRGRRTRGGMAANDSAAPAPTVAKAAPARRMAYRPKKKSIKFRSGTVSGSLAKPDGAKNNRGPGATLAKARKRRDFRETAVWLASVMTNNKGEAVVSFQWPDSLTSWSVRAVVVGKGVRVGAVKMTTRTNQKLMAQIAAPRFFTVGDKAKIAVVAFNRSKAQKVRVRLKVKGLKLIGKAEQRGFLKPGEDKRFVFEVKATEAGKVHLSADIASSIAADAVEVKRTVEAFGLDRYVSAAGSLFKKGKATMPIRLPRKFSKGSGKLELAIASSLTRSIFDSLGYLVKFPYGCVEQTMSRFLPASLVAKTLTGLDKSDPKLAKKLPKVINAGLERLYNFQHDDGGWGWWQYDRTNDFMTAYVIFGLSTAKTAGYKIRAGVLSRAANYLKGRMGSLRSKPALHAYALYSLSMVGQLPTKEVDHSLANIKKLNSYGLALLSLAYSRKGDTASAKYVLKKLRKRLTAFQGGEQAYFPGRGTMRGWAEDGVEATAVALRAFIVGKVYKKEWPRIARWLLNNRKGKRWRSTRDTAQAILALSSFATAVGEGKGTRKVKIVINGKIEYSATLDPSNPRGSGWRVTLKDDFIRRHGLKKIEVFNVNGGPIYYGMQLSYRTEETNISAGGSGILSIQRKYFKVIRKGSSVRFRQIHSGEPVKAGTEVEVRLTIRGKNKLSYLLFADRKPAGLEPVQIKSGAPMRAWLSHQEFRDTHVAFFAGSLKRNKDYRIKYRMRAERPGRYRTLPTVGAPMYVPKANGHSSSFVFVITP